MRKTLLFESLQSKILILGKRSSEIGVAMWSSLSAVDRGRHDVANVQARKETLRQADTKTHSMEKLERCLIRNGARPADALRRPRGSAQGHLLVRRRRDAHGRRVSQPERPTARPSLHRRGMGCGCGHGVQQGLARCVHSRRRQLQDEGERRWVESKVQGPKSGRPADSSESRSVKAGEGQSVLNNIVAVRLGTTGERSFWVWASFRLSYRVVQTCAFAKASPKPKNPRSEWLHYFLKRSSR